jgi:YHS domain-containing protein
MKYSRSRYGSVSEGPTVVNDRKDGYFGINDYGREPNSRSNFPMSFSEEVIRDVQEMITKYRKLIPFIVVLKLVIIAIGLVYAYKFSFSELSDSSLIVGESDCTDECPRFVTRPNCTDANYPVLGGLDFVQYFTFENENMTGLIGNPNISTIYNGYEFYFLSEDNRAIFESDPEKYSPQYGGNYNSNNFCRLGCKFFVFY